MLGHKVKESTYLAEVCVFDIEKTVLQSATASRVDFVPNSSHPVGKSGQPSCIGRGLTSDEGFLRECSSYSLSDKCICLMSQLLDDLMGRCRVENIMLYWHIFVVQLMEKAKRWYILRTRSITTLAKFLCNCLLIFS